MVKIIGYCFEEGKLGGVYALDPLDSLHNLAPKDEFSWRHRVKVIYELAKLLEFLHTLNPPYLPYRVGNIDAAHIILDKDYSPKLLDFGMTIGGIILSLRESRIQRIRKRCFHYVPHSDHFYEEGDILGFGCIIVCLFVCLLHKKVPTRDVNVKEEKFIPDLDALKDRNKHLSMKNEYLERKKKGQLSNDEHLESEMLKEFSFVHKSLEKDEDFNENDGVELTNLAMDCVDGYPYDRPSMDEVVTRLGKLHLIEKMGYLKLYEAQC